VYTLFLVHSLINLALFSATIFQSWKSRHLSTEFQEAQYIFRALIGILLVAFIGVPVLIIARDNTNSRVFVTSGIIFVMCSLILLLIFVPKIQYEKSTKSVRPGITTHISGLNMGTSSGGLNSGLGNVPESVNLERPSIVSAIHDDSESGERIFSSKTQSELVMEVAALKRYIGLLKARLETQGKDLSSNNTNVGNGADIHRLIRIADPDGEDGGLVNSSTIRSSDYAFPVPLELGGTASTTGHDEENTFPREIKPMSSSAVGECLDATYTQHQNPESHPMSEEQL
jgi:hypothetical protein